MSQCDTILGWLKLGRCISSLDALHRFGCFRLAARIAELRERGYSIDSSIVETRTGKRLAVYKLHTSN